MNKPDIILRTRTVASALVSVLAQYDLLKAEYDALEVEDALEDLDFYGSDVTLTDFTDGVGALQHVADARGSGYGTKLFKIKL